MRNTNRANYVLHCRTKFRIHTLARKALIERYKLSSGEKTSYSICLSILIAVTNIARSTPDLNDRMYWDTEKNNYFSSLYVLGQLKK